MKVLTVREPWLSAIVAKAKNVENRGIGLLPAFRRLEGHLIGLHGATSWSARGAADPRVCAVHGGLLEAPERVAGFNVHPWCDGFGLIVATARVDDAHHAGEWCDPRVCFPWGEREYHREGRGWVTRDVVHVVLAEVTALDCVIPARGRLGLWECDELDELAE